MLTCLEQLRQLYWSDICVADSDAYSNYCAFVENGLRIIATCCSNGSAKLIGGECSCADTHIGSQSALGFGCDARCNPLVGGVAIDNYALGAKDNVDCGIGARGLVVLGGGLPVGGVSDGKRCRVSCGVDEVASSSDEQHHTQVDGGSVEMSSDVKSAGCFAKKGSNFLPRGPNFERNKANREMKKRKKMQRSLDGSAVVASQVLSDQRASGFWNSCSEAVRQSLIDSKAKMHIAENKRKAIEAEQKCEDMLSPYARMLKAVKMAECAIKQKEKDGNNKIFGWAETVANASAENLARSVPDSAPSFEELSSKLQASSQSSFELELHAKDVELKEQKNKNDLLQDQINELLVQQSIAKSQSSILEKARIKSEKNSRNKVKNTPQDKYAVWNSKHVQLTRADIERDMYYS